MFSWSQKVSKQVLRSLLKSTFGATDSPTLREPGKVQVLQIIKTALFVHIITNIDLCAGVLFDYLFPTHGHFLSFAKVDA